MGQQFPEISEKHRDFIQARTIFFVASAPPKGRVNVSPMAGAGERVSR